ncbi:SDR family oxidoreductase [Streptomyces sp. NPDC048282]|uniref:SDR family oxidoreductase n=1 Tax=Streptomyces sp. NPDC048282 TaxID=3365528 RepID=UPI00371B0B32
MVARSVRRDGVQRTARATGSARRRPAASVQGRVVEEQAVPEHAVRVNAVAPGAVDTPWWDFPPRERRRAQLAAGADTVPAGRAGSAEDVAAALRHLVDAPGATGPVLPADGGFTVT